MRDIANTKLRVEHLSNATGAVDPSAGAAANDPGSTSPPPAPTKKVMPTATTPVNQAVATVKPNITPLVAQPAPTQTPVVVMQSSVPSYGGGGGGGGGSEIESTTSYQPQVSQAGIGAFFSTPIGKLVLAAAAGAALVMFFNKK